MGSGRGRENDNYRVTLDAAVRHHGAKKISAEK